MTRPEVTGKKLSLVADDADAFSISGVLLAGTAYPLSCFINSRATCRRRSRLERAG